MGNEQATRRVTFEREPTGLIAVSDSVARRLQNAEKSVRTLPAQSAPVHHISAPSSRSSQPPPDNPFKSAADQDTQVLWDSSEQQRFIYTPSVSQEDHAEALKQVETQWQERHSRLLSDMEKIGQHSADEFTRTHKQIEELFATKSQAVGNAELEEAVMKCYRENTTRSLKCAKEAEAFIKSVENYKFAFLEKRAA